MITNKLLRECLFSIFFYNKLEYEKFIAPINYSWYIPKESINNLQDTWIGYSVMSHSNLQPATQHGSILLKNVKTRFRITFTGQHAEEFANSTLLWDNREDVNKIFLEKMYAQLNYNEQHLYLKIAETDDPDGLFVWVTDMSANSYYVVDNRQIPWVPINGKIKLMDNQQIVDLFPFDEKTKNYREMTLEETLNCKDRLPGKFLDDSFCKNANCNCLYKDEEEVHLCIDSQELLQGRKAKYTGATKFN